MTSIIDKMGPLIYIRYQFHLTSVDIKQIKVFDNPKAPRSMFLWTHVYLLSKFNLMFHYDVMVY